MTSFPVLMTAHLQANLKSRMADRPNSIHTANGLALEEDDMFERDLNEMLQDGPSLNDFSQTVNAQAVDLGTGMTRKPPTSLPNVTKTNSSPNMTAPATTDIPLSSPTSRSMSSTSVSPKSPGSNTSVQLSSKLENIKEWSLNTLKCTKQMISERLGKGTRTVDLELESQIEVLRDTQKRYSNILRLARALTSHFHNVVQTQRQLGDAFGDLSQKNPELQEEFQYNAETQKVLSRNGETLLGALNFFTSSVNTLCNKTMEDTILTIRNYETARLEFDAYKSDFESVKTGPRDSNNIPKLEEAQKKFDAHKEKFEKLRADVNIKLKFLNENKVKVMHKQLLLFHNAVSAYFSGNQTALESTLKQFNIKLHPPNSEKPSWLEQ